MKKFLPRIITISVVIIIFGGILGYLFGYPWEHIIAQNKARNYVVEKYNLTPTSLSSKFFFTTNQIAVNIYTKENDFVFMVTMNREMNYIKDTYLEGLAAYYLCYEANNYVKEITGDNGEVYVVLNTNIINELHITKEEIISDLLFEKLKNKYYFGIVLNENVIESDYKIDYEMNYKIFRHILDDKLQPTEIVFTYYSNKNESSSALRVRIEKEAYDKIKSSEDLIPYFKKAIEKLNT